MIWKLIQSALLSPTINLINANWKPSCMKSELNLHLQCDRNTEFATWHKLRIFKLSTNLNYVKLFIVSYYVSVYDVFLSAFFAGFIIYEIFQMHCNSCRILWNLREMVVSHFHSCGTTQWDPYKLRFLICPDNRAF